MLLNDLALIQKKYPEFVFTNCNAKGELVNRAVYIFPRNTSRRGNVLLEIWQLPDEGCYDFYIKKTLMTNEEYGESLDSYNKTTGTRGRLTRSLPSNQELIDFIAYKLELARQLL